MLLQKDIFSLPKVSLCPPTLCPLLARRLIFSDPPPSPFPFLASADCFQFVAKTELFIFLTKRQLFHPFANLANTSRCCRTMKRRGSAIYIRSTERSKLDKLPKSPPQNRHFCPYSFSIWFYEKRKLLFHLKGYTYNMTFSADLTYEWNSIKLWKCKPAKSFSSNIFTDFTHAINALQYDYYQNIKNKISDTYTHKQKPSTKIKTGFIGDKNYFAFFAERRA